MTKQPFREMLAGPRVELRRPALTREHAAEMYELLQRNDFFWPWRISLRECKSAADCINLIDNRIFKIENMTDSFYDIFVDDVYTGEVYARDIDYKNDIVRNLGYFIDKSAQGKGYATEAVLTLDSEMFRMGANKICLFTHFIDDKNRNFASERVAKKAGYQKEGVARSALKISDGLYASEIMFGKLAVDTVRGNR